VMHRVRPVAKKAGKQRKAAHRAHQSRQPGGAARLASAVTDETVALDPAEVTERRRAATTCGWCGTPMQPKARAAESGLAAVKVVERRVEVAVAAAPTRRDWARLLHDLARQLDDGRVYDRDLADLSVALNAVLDAYRRRPHVRVRAADVSPFHRG
jgi:hypothetical protein